MDENAKEMFSAEFPWGFSTTIGSLFNDCVVPCIIIPESWKMSCIQNRVNVR
jgi:hypothetical protein